MNLIPIAYIVDLDTDTTIEAVIFDEETKLPKKWAIHRGSTSMHKQTGIFWEIVKDPNHHLYASVEEATAYYRAIHKTKPRRHIINFKAEIR